MKARRNAAAPTKVSPTHERGLEISPHKKMLKMKVAPQSLLKTKGQKKCSSGFVENNRVIVFSGLLYDKEGFSDDFRASIPED
jgi:hypothetical protein